MIRCGLNNRNSRSCSTNNTDFLYNHNNILSNMNSRRQNRCNNNLKKLILKLKKIYNKNRKLNSPLISKIKKMYKSTRYHIWVNWVVCRLSIWFFEHFLTDKALIFLLIFFYILSFLGTRCGQVLPVVTTVTTSHTDVVSLNPARVSALDSNHIRLGLLASISKIGSFRRALRLPQPTKTGRHEKRLLKVALIK